MATLTINSWTFTPLNPDGTDNTFLPSIAGSVPADPTADLIDFIAMGQRVKLSLSFTIAGTLPDTSTASVVGSTINYAPALFAAYLAPYYPSSVFPKNGYSIVVPSSSAATYTMQLVGQGVNLGANENGLCEIEIIDAQNFTITHDFYITTDVEGYTNGKGVQNFTRLSKTTVSNPLEDSIAVNSVFGSLRGLNLKVGFQQNTYTVLARDLSIPIKAAFNGYDQNGDATSLPVSITIALDEDPLTEIDYLDPFKDNLVTVTIDDPTALIVEDESELQFTNRTLTTNQNTFEKDLQLVGIKLTTDPSTGQISGPIYGPITWDQSAGLTIISFIVKASELSMGDSYQLHFRGAYQPDPSSSLMMHGMTGILKTDGSPTPVEFEMGSAFWTRNGKTANNFSCAPLERVTSVFEMNITDYQANGTAEFENYYKDINSVTCEIFDEDDQLIFTSTVIGNLGVFPDGEFIGNELEVGPSETIQRFYLKAFRVPGYNEQNLDDWRNKTYKFRWSALFLFNPDLGLRYFVDGNLTVRDYENAEVSPKVSNVRFVNPTTGYQISNWCDLNEVLVRADIQNVDDDVYVAVMVDRFPLGTQLHNDLALEEEDPATHTLPDYVIFNQKLTDLVSQLDSQPTDGVITFAVDVSELSNDAKWRIYVQAYTVEP